MKGYSATQTGRGDKSTLPLFTTLQSLKRLTKLHGRGEVSVGIFGGNVEKGTVPVIAEMLSCALVSFKFFVSYKGYL